jgi:hypothetical protein
VALEKRALVDVKVPIGDADGEVAERVGCDVDAARNKTVTLRRREGSVVPDDVGNRIGHRREAPSSGILRDSDGPLQPEWPGRRTGSMTTAILSTAERAREPGHFQERI